jgi:hypothetical protein
VSLPGGPGAFAVPCVSHRFSLSLSLSLAATWGPTVNPHGFFPILASSVPAQDAGANSGLRRAKDLRSGRLGPPHPSPSAGRCVVMPGPSGVSTSFVQAAVCRQPRQSNPFPPGFLCRRCLSRLAHAHRAWPLLQSLTTMSLRTSVRRQDPYMSRSLHIPSTPLEPSVAPCSLPVSPPSAVNACARRNPALRAHVTCPPNRPILPCRVCVCACTGAVHRCTRCHVQPPPPGQAQAARARRWMPFTRNWHCLCSPRYAGTPALLRACMRPPRLCARVHGSALLRQAPRRRQAVPSVAPRARV